MRNLVAVLRQGLVVELTRRVGIERQVELVFPAEVEARLAHRVIADLSGRMPLGEVSRVRRYAEENGFGGETAIESGLQAKAAEFRQAGGEIYVDADKK